MIGPYIFSSRIPCSKTVLRLCSQDMLHLCTRPCTRSLNSGVTNAKLVFLGAPGVGKGTYAGILARTWKIPHISTGNLLRQEIAASTPLGLLVKDMCSEGGLVSDEIVVEICRRRLADADCSAGWILDGFPRTVNQAKVLRTFAPPTLCVNILLRRDILLKKLLARRMCAECGASVNLAEYYDGEYELSPIPVRENCKKCSGNPTLVQRPDDSDQVIKYRLELYDEQSPPILRVYIEEKTLFQFEMKRGLKDVPLLAERILARLRDVNVQQNSSLLPSCIP